METPNAEIWKNFRQSPDEAAFEALYERTRAPVWSVCLCVLRNEEDARDAFQGAYARLLELARTGQGNGGAEDGDDLLAVARRMAAREANRLFKQRQRRAQREVAMEIPPAGPPVDATADRIAANNELRRILEALIAQLPPKSQVPIRLHYFEGMTHREIARALDEPAGTISVRIARGLSKLRRMSRKAGLGELSAAFAGAALAGQAFGPPTAAAATVFVQAQAMAGASLATAAAIGTPLIAKLMGVGAMKLKLGLIAVALVCAGAVGVWSVAKSHKPKTGQETANAGRDISAGTVAAADATPAEDAAVESVAARPEESKDSRTSPPGDVSTPPAPPAKPLQTLHVKAIWADTRQDAGGTTFTLTAREPRRVSMQTTSAKGDEKGEATLEFSVDCFMGRLTAYHPEAAMKSISGLDLPMLEPVLVELDRGATVFGHVWIEGEGKPASGAKVGVSSIREGQLQSAIAAADGSFEFRNLGEEIRFWAESPPYRYNADPTKGTQSIRLAAGMRNGPYDLVLKPGITLAGRITDAVSGEPLREATVTWISTVAHSDSEGKYRLEGLYPPYGEIDIARAGYVLQRKNLQLSLDQMELSHDFQLDPAILVDVFVEDEQGNPVEGASIRRLEEGYVYYSATDSVTDAKGHIQVDGISPNKPQPLIAEKEGYEKSSQVVPQAKVGEEQVEIVLTLQPKESKKGSFIGRVTDSKGNPVAGARVRWQPYEYFSSSWEDMRTATWADGRYRLDVEIHPQPFRLECYGKGWSPVWKTDVIPGSTDNPREVNFTLEQSHWLEGHVVDKEDRPIDRALVRLTIKERNKKYDIPGFPNVGIDTNASGIFRFDDLPGGKINVQIEQSGYKDLSVDDVAVDQSLPFKMERFDGVIRGRALDEVSNHPITDFTFKIKGIGISVSNYTQGHSVLAEDGRFLVESLAADTEYRLTIEAAGYSPRIVENIRAEDAANAKENEFRLKKGTLLHGVVQDAQTGAPVQGAPVTYAIYNGKSRVDWSDLNGFFAGLMGVQASTTGADGAFSFQEEEPDGALLVAIEGYERFVLLPQNRAGALRDGRLTLAMRRGAAIQGYHIHNGSPQPASNVQLNRKPDNENEPAQYFGELLTDASGAYRWNNLPPGLYELIWRQAELAPAAYRALTREVRIGAGESRIVNLGAEMGPLWIEGRVMEGDKPAPRATIELKPVFAWDYTQIQTRADDQGHYRIDGLIPGAYEATARLGVYRPTDQDTVKATIEIAGPTHRDWTISPPD